MRRGNRGVLGIAMLAVVLGALVEARAHETDNFTVLPGRPVADLGRTLDAFFHRRLVAAMEGINDRIRDAAENGGEVPAELYEPATIARAMRRALPGAYAMIEGFGRRAESGDLSSRHPGKVVGHKRLINHVYQGAHLPIDPRQLFKLWFAPTIKVHGVYLGTDKLGHFTGMGGRYAKAYYQELQAGGSEAEGMAAARRLGTEDPLLSESGMLGYISAGAYSNADLASNHAGLLFYRNLTETITIGERALPPMLERDGRHWKLSSRAAHAPGLLEPFVTDHWDESLNPSLFDGSMRGGMRRSIRKRGAGLLWRHRAPSGAHRPPGYFIRLAESLSSFHGQAYGHRGEPGELITLAVCFETPEEADAHNHAGYTPLHLAAIKGDPAATRAWIKAGGDANAMLMCSRWDEVEYAATPLHLAAEHGHHDVAEALIEAGATVDRPSGSGIRPIHRAADESMVALLVRAGAEASIRDDAGRTVLHHAAMREAPSVMRLLVDRHGLKVSATDHRRRTALHAAVEAGAAGAARWLIDRGAAVDAEAKLGRTPLHRAVARGEAAMVRLLLERGADADRADAVGLTPLHIAVLERHPQCAGLLMEAGASAEVADRFGRTPMELAKRCGHRACQAMLSSGADRSSNAKGERP